MEAKVGTYSLKTSFNIFTLNIANILTTIYPNKLCMNHLNKCFMFTFISIFSIFFFIIFF